MRGKRTSRKGICIVMCVLLLMILTGNNMQVFGSEDVDSANESELDIISITPNADKLSVNVKGLSAGKATISLINKYGAMKTVDIYVGLKEE